MLSPLSLRYHFWFPHSRVGIHTSVNTLIQVSVPTQERGNERIQQPTVFVASNGELNPTEIKRGQPRQA